jgi:hypothetical protein
MIVKGNVNGYDKDRFKLDFASHNIYLEGIKKDKSLNSATLQFDSFFPFKTMVDPKMDNDLSTPRLINLQLNSSFSMAPLYYLDLLLKQNPTSIIDIGCGANMFKRIIPCIHGIDPVPDNPHADEVGSFDSEFSRAHKDEYESVFAINSVHFVSLSNFEKRMLEFINIVKPGGRGFVTFNATRMLELTSKEELEQLFSTQIINGPLVINYVRNIIQNISVKFLVIDLYIDKEINEIMNGNIRLVFEK